MLGRPLSSLVLQELPNGAEPDNVVVLEIYQHQIIPTRSSYVGGMMDDLKGRSKPERSKSSWVVVGIVVLITLI